MIYFLTLQYYFKGDAYLSLTPEQTIGAKEWNKIIQSNVSTALGSKLPGKFIAANYAPGFDYAVRQTYYNEDSLSALNTLLCERDDIPVIEDVYSALYQNVIGVLEYNISEKDKERLNQEETDNEALVGTIKDIYEESDLDDEPKDDAKIMYIMNRIKEVTGNDYLHLDTKTYPNLSALCNKLSEYARVATFTSKFQNDWSSAVDKMNQINTNITNPSSENGGIKIANDKFYIGWDKLPQTETLLKDLKNEKNSISFSVSVDSFSDTQSVLHFESDVKAKVPFNWIFNLQVEHEHEFDLSKYSCKDSNLNIAIEFKGITTVAAVPTPISANLQKGWFAADMLKEAAEKSGKDVTGICLGGGRYDPDKLFGENGELRRINMFVISQQPYITLKFYNFECSGFEQYFEQDTKVKFNILGGLISGTHNNDFSCTSKEYDENSKTLTVKLAPPAIGSSGSLGKQTAYVLGGTAEYFPRT